MTKFEEALKVDCPLCGAVAGSGCMYISAPFRGLRCSTLHNERLRQATLLSSLTGGNSTTAKLVPLLDWQIDRLGERFSDYDDPNYFRVMARAVEEIHGITGGQEVAFRLRCRVCGTTEKLINYPQGPCCNGPDCIAF